MTQRSTPGSVAETFPHRSIRECMIIYMIAFLRWWETGSNPGIQHQEIRKFNVEYYIAVKITRQIYTKAQGKIKTSVEHKEKK